MNHTQGSTVAGTQWTVARIASDPAGAYAYIRELVDSRNKWKRKFDHAEMTARKAAEALAKRA